MPRSERMERRNAFSPTSREASLIRHLFAEYSDHSPDLNELRSNGGENERSILIHSQEKINVFDKSSNPPHAAPSA